MNWSKFYIIVRSLYFHSFDLSNGLHPQTSSDYQLRAGVCRHRQRTGTWQLYTVTENGCVPKTGGPRGPRLQRMFYLDFASLGFWKRFWEQSYMAKAGDSLRLVKKLRVKLQAVRIQLKHFMDLSNMAKNIKQYIYIKAIPGNNMK